VALVESVKENKGEVRMFSAQHESGKRTSDISHHTTPVLIGIPLPLRIVCWSR
jgi:hypothetical protein